MNLSVKMPVAIVKIYLGGVNSSNDSNKLKKSNANIKKRLAELPKFECFWLLLLFDLFISSWKK